MQLFEMQGLLAGKCLPSDMKVNESLAEYLLRKLEDRNELERQLSAKTISEQNIINAFGISGEGAHSKLVIEYVHGLVAENSELKQFPEQIVSFVGKLGTSEVGHDTREKIETAAKRIKMINSDAAIAEIKAQGVDELIADRKSEWMVSYCEDAADFAANLRAGRKG
jgi:hypothetical protein